MLHVSDFQALQGLSVDSRFSPVRYAIQDVNCSFYSYYYDLNNCNFNIADNSVCGVGGSSSVAGVVCRESKYI